MRTVIITSPSLDETQNVSGISAVAQLVIRRNRRCRYTHFCLGKPDGKRRGTRWLIETLSAYGRWFRTLRSDPRALIHFNLALDWRCLLRDSPLIALARLLARTIVVHLHGGAFFSDPGPPDWLRFLLRVIVGPARLIVLSDRERGLLNETFSSRQMFVLPNCVDLDEARHFDRTFDSCGELSVLFLGRIATNKGIDVIYQALAAAKRSGLRLRFVMAGAGPAESVYAERFRELLGEAFDFRGVVAGARKTELLKRCQVYLLPSLFEGMPMALLECMAFGLVPIATPVGAIPTIITNGENGFLVNKQAPDEIVEVLGNLAGNGENVRRVSANARRWVFKTLAPEAYIARLNAIYGL